MATHMDKVFKAVDKLEKELSALDRKDFSTTNSHRLTVVRRKLEALKKLLDLIEQDEG